jgi:hypothetical protein
MVGKPGIPGFLQSKKSVGLGLEGGAESGLCFLNSEKHRRRDFKCALDWA